MYLSEDRPVVSPVAFRTPQRLHQDQRKDVAFDERARARPHSHSPAAIAAAVKLEHRESSWTRHNSRGTLCPVRRWSNPASHLVSLVQRRQVQNQEDDCNNDFSPIKPVLSIRTEGGMKGKVVQSRRPQRDDKVRSGFPPAG